MGLSYRKRVCDDFRRSKDESCQMGCKEGNNGGEETKGEQRWKRAAVLSSRPLVCPTTSLKQAWAGSKRASHPIAGVISCRLIHIHDIAPYKRRVP